MFRDYILVAGLDEQTHVCVHEGDRHGHIGAVRKDGAGICSPLLDEAEDVVPAVMRMNIRR